jgi:hypothetical protein
MKTFFCRPTAPQSGKQHELDWDRQPLSRHDAVYVCVKSGFGKTCLFQLINCRIVTICLTLFKRIGRQELSILGNYNAPLLKLCILLSN